MLLNILHGDRGELQERGYNICFWFLYGRIVRNGTSYKPLLTGVYFPAVLFGLHYILDSRQRLYERECIATAGVVPNVHMPCVLS